MERRGSEKIPDARGKQAREAGPRPIGAGITGIDVRHTIWRHQITQPDTGGVAGPERFRSRCRNEGFCNRAADTSELSVSKDAGHPTPVELPVVTGADRAEIAAAAEPLFVADGGPACVEDLIAIRGPQSAARTTENIKAGPVGDRLRHHGRPGGGSCWKVGRESRSSEYRDRCRSQHQLLHMSPPRPERLKSGPQLENARSSMLRPACWPDHGRRNPRHISSVPIPAP